MAPAAETLCIDLRCPVEGGYEVAASVFVPPRTQPIVPWVLCCLPGSGLTRRYYDLASGEDHAYSFARLMVDLGFVSITCDMIGTGESSRPADGWSVTPDLIAAANAQAVRQVLERLREGALEASLPAFRDLVPVGVGHSLGAVTTLVQAAHHGSYRALVLLGYGGGGFPSELNGGELALANDAAAIRANVARLARARYPEPYWRLAASPRTRDVYGGGGDRGAMSALRAAGTEMLATAGLFSMIPGSVRAESESLDLPIFLAIGDRDITGPPHRVPACFPASRDVQLLVLRDTGHTHFVFPTMRALSARIAAWLAAAVPAGAAP